MTLTAKLDSLVFDMKQVRYEPPMDFYNPNLTIVTHKTKPYLAD